MNHPTIEYFAGFFDGEGSIYMMKRPICNQSKTHTFRLTICVSNTNQTVLNHFCQTFGGSVRKSNTGTNKQMFQWYIRDIGGCLKFLNQITSFLIDKKAQAALALNWLNHRLQFPLKSVPAQYDIDFAYNVYHKLKQLKNRPHATSLVA